MTALNAKLLIASFCKEIGAEHKQLYTCRHEYSSKPARSTSGLCARKKFDLFVRFSGHE